MNKTFAEYMDEIEKRDNPKKKPVKSSKPDQQLYPAKKLEKDTDISDIRQLKR
jgi:hypothetical protein